MSVQDLCWGAACKSGHIPQLQETMIKLLAVDVAGRHHHENEVLDRLDGSLGVAIGLWVVQRRHGMVDTPQVTVY